MVRSVSPEFLADPSPSVNLPQSEFIEITNFSERVFALEDFMLRVGSTDIEFPTGFLEPMSSLIVCPQEFEQEFSVFGKTLPLENYSTISDDGETLTPFL